MPDDYTRRVNQMNENIDHHGQCVPSQKRKKSKSPPKKDVKPNFDSVNEKLLVLRDENIHLKQKKKDLEDDVKLIVGAGGSLYAKIDEDLDLLLEENIKLQDEEQRLIIQVKKLQGKKKSGNSKMLRTTLDGYHSRSRSPDKKPKQDFTLDLTNLRNHIEQSNKTILDLKNEIEFSRRATSGQVASEDLVQQLRKKEIEVLQQRAKLEELQDSLGVKDEIFKQNEAYQNGLLAELKQLKTDQLNLQSENRALDEASKTAEFLQKQVQDTMTERNKLQQEFNNITKQPFFKREIDQSTFKKINDLQVKIEEKEKQIKDSKATILNTDEQLRKLAEESRSLKIERDTYHEEIERLRLQLDPSNLTLSEIQKRIHDLDPSMFRQVMKDLKYDGEEPIWARFDFMERLKMGPNNQPLDENDPFALKQEIEKLKRDRRDLAAELEKTQNLLKMQVSIDKQNQHLYQSDINQLKSQIINDNNRIQELNQLIIARSQKLLTISKTSGLNQGQLTAAGLANLDKELEKLQRGQKDDEVLTEFSVVTDESEIAPQENVLDLIVNTAQFDKQRLSQLLGNKELLPGALQTFLTVDFYNHDTRNSDLAEGFEPNYSTQFSFKNTVDDFYVSYLEKNVITVEFFLSRAQNALKLGTAKIVLSKILEKDHSFQAAEILHDGGELGATFSLGRVLYKMRMRRPIDEAVKWYQQKKQLKMQRDPTSIINEYQPNAYGPVKRRSKAITVHVLRCFDLKRPDKTYNSKEMQPFFYFGFFTFEYTSPILAGSNPFFDVKKTFEVEINEQFMEYMKTQVLKIDIIDESVDLSQANAQDYIGSVRIPLRELMIHEDISDNFTVKDDKGQETGRMEVKLMCKDYVPYPYETGDGNDPTDGTFRISKYAEKEIINKIAEKFAQSEMDEIDLIFDMLLTPTDNYKITKGRFKDYLLSTMNVREQDIDILLKTNMYIQNKDYIDKNDFKNMFEMPIIQARQKRMEDYNDRFRKYQAAQTYLQQQNTLGLSQTNAKNPFLNESINQREPINEGMNSNLNNTGKFMNKQPSIGSQQQDYATQLSQISGKARQQLEQDKKSLLDIIKEKAYHIINKFDETVPKGQIYAEWDDFKKVMLTYTQNEDDIANLWSSCHIDMKFFYQDFIIELSTPAKKQEAPILSIYKEFSKREQNPRLLFVKEKLYHHLLKNDLGLHDLFRFLDKDKSKSVTIPELTKGMQGILTEQECVELFAAADRDNSNTITPDELISECSKIHSGYVLSKLKNAIENAKGQTIDTVFNTIDDNNNGLMEITEFNQMINLLYEGVDKYEVDALFKHFDTKGVGRITKEEFKKALQMPVNLEKKLQFTLHDFMTPLKTLLKRYNLKPEGIFDKFSKDKKYISIKDIREIMLQFLKIDLTEEEIELIQGAISGFYGPSTGGLLDRNQFINFLTKDYLVKSFAAGDGQIAKSTLIKLKSFIEWKKKPFMEQIKPFLDEVAQQNKNQQPVINIRNLKMALFILFSLPPYEIENLTDHFDKDHNGFIGVLDLDKAIQLK